MDRADVVEYLLAHGEDVNQQDANEETVLHFSASLNSFRSCKLFIESGADVNLISKSGYSPLHLASENGASDIVELLLSSKAVADVPNHKGQTALHVLAMTWDSASARWVGGGRLRGVGKSEWVREGGGGGRGVREERREGQTERGTEGVMNASSA